MNTIPDPTPPEPEPESPAQKHARLQADRNRLEARLREIKAAETGHRLLILGTDGPMTSAMINAWTEIRNREYEPERAVIRAELTAIHDQCRTLRTQLKRSEIGLPPDIFRPDGSLINARAFVHILRRLDTLTDLVEDVSNRLKAIEERGSLSPLESLRDVHP